MSSEELARRIIELAGDKKGHQIVLMDIAGLTTIADYFVIVSGDSNVQIKAIADHIEHELRDEGRRLHHKEGYQYQNWILLDYGDVIVHIFGALEREFYQLDELWREASPVLRIQ